jgi:hypothetical protein
VASAFQEDLTADLLAEVLTTANMELKEVVLRHLDEIYARFVINVGRPPS